MALEPEEIEFLAEWSPISIVPNFNLVKLYLMTGDLGPFRAGLPISVPFWLAINLRARAKCRILIPDWIDVGYLESLKKAELDSVPFVPMPSEHWVVIAKRLLEVCCGDIQQADDLKTLIKDIYDIRTSKWRTSFTQFLGADSSVAILDNLTQMEISSIRPFYPHVLEQIHRIKKGANRAFAIAQTAANNSQSQSQNSHSHSILPHSSGSGGGLGHSQSQLQH